MPLFLRAIRKARWHSTAWLDPNELQADALLDLETKENELSVWAVKEDKSNLERVFAAVAASRDRPSNLDYALFGDRPVLDLGIRIDKSLGQSPDDVANEWHYDLKELSVTRVSRLSLVIAQGFRDRIPEAQIRSLLMNSLDARALDLRRLKLSMLARLMPTAVERCARCEPIGKCPDCAGMGYMLLRV